MNTPQAMIISHQSKRRAEQGPTARALASYSTTLSIASLLEPALVISVGALLDGQDERGENRRHDPSCCHDGHAGDRSLVAPVPMAIKEFALFAGSAALLRASLSKSSMSVRRPFLLARWVLLQARNGLLRVFGKGWPSPIGEGRHAPLGRYNLGATGRRAGSQWPSGLWLRGLWRRFRPVTFLLKDRRTRRWGRQPARRLRSHGRQDVFRDHANEHQQQRIGIAA